ncbi:MAG: YbgC/FadM family acyl-CoA thioesterase [Polaromonas sp.]|nr:MAG: YbgC/FadM family acyl-CoA thioesterase [Polaromonas sp.]
MDKRVAPFGFAVRVYWEDTDAGGIVFYANYLKFFERARTEWLRSLGVEQQKLKDTSGGMFVVAQTCVRYLRPARLDDALVVTARLVDKGRASMTICQQTLLKSEHINNVNSASEPILLCEGTVKIGWVDAATLKPARMPGCLLERLKT